VNHACIRGAVYEVRRGVAKIKIAPALGAARLWQAFENITAAEATLVVGVGHAAVIAQPQCGPQQCDLGLGYNAAMRRRSRTRSFFMWAAIAVSGLLVALWGRSLAVHAGVQNGPRGIWLTLHNGVCVAACFGKPPNWMPRAWYCQQGRPSNPYGCELPRVSWHGPDLYSIKLPLWAPLLMSTSAAVLLCRSGRRVPRGHRPKCGYDLTGNVSGRCPECGCLWEKQT
jgi:hypothetical protein